jgi:hypothetical protein
MKSRVVSEASRVADRCIRGSTVVAAARPEAVAALAASAKGRHRLLAGRGRVRQAERRLGGADLRLPDSGGGRATETHLQPPSTTANDDQ